MGYCPLIFWILTALLFWINLFECKWLADFPWVRIGFCIRKKREKRAKRKILGIPLKTTFIELHEKFVLVRFNYLKSREVIEIGHKVATGNWETTSTWILWSSLELKVIWWELIFARIFLELICEISGNLCNFWAISANSKWVLLAVDINVRNPVKIYCFSRFNWFTTFRLEFAFLGKSAFHQSLKICALSCKSKKFVLNYLCVIC